MRRRLNGVYRLTRFREYIFFVVVTTFIGAAAGRGTLGWPLFAVLLANWLAVGFAFMINDVEDAPDDALNPAKVHRNPVSAGDLPAHAAQGISFGVALLAAAIYWQLGPWPFAAGLSCLVIAHLYSWRAVRLKTLPGLDLISHGLMLAGLQFFTAYLTFTESPDGRWIFPFVFLVAMSIYGELFNEMRDLEGDLRAGLKHTASVMGPRMTQWAMVVLLVVAAVSMVVTILVIGLIPMWVLGLLAVLEVIFLAPTAWDIRGKRSALEVQAPMHVPAVHAGAITVLIWFASPWLARWVDPVVRWLGVGGMKAFLGF